MIDSINKAIELKNELDKLRPISKEQELRIMQKFKLDWNYHSNHLEGNSLTYGETKALILFNITAQGKPLKDHIEMTGHDEAVKWIYDVVKDEYPLTENFIRELHSLLLKESFYVDAITPEGLPTLKKIEIVKYKSIPNHAQTVTGEIFRFATPEETPAKMYDLIQWFSEKKKTEDINPIILATEFHYRFIRIHPFHDGNGRTARILMNFILMQFGYPPVIIKTEDKATYFSVLRLADADDIKPFIKYISDNLIHSIEIMIRGAKGEEIEDTVSPFDTL
jgi:Fic family protein